MTLYYSVLSFLLTCPHGLGERSNRMTSHVLMTYYRSLPPKWQITVPPLRVPFFCIKNSISCTMRANTENANCFYSIVNIIIGSHNCMISMITRLCSILIRIDVIYKLCSARIQRSYCLLFWWVYWRCLIQVQLLLVIFCMLCQSHIWLKYCVICVICHTYIHTF